MNRYKSITIGNNYILDVNGKWVEYKDVEKLQKKIDRLREALEFYENESNYNIRKREYVIRLGKTVNYPILSDEGELAREALK